MSLRVHHVIYNRLNSVYWNWFTSSDIEQLVQSTPEAIPRKIHDYWNCKNTKRK